MDLEKLLSKSLNAKQTSLLQQVANVCANENMSVYLVGGAVRDTLLGLPVQDIDLVVEGNAQLLALLLAKKLGGKVKSHPHFDTASLTAKGVQVDLATARKEIYPQPGALPEVSHSHILDDLKRRDFSINTMAIPIGSHANLEIIDVHDGLYDLQNKIIRILHDQSFADDPTRMLRGVRYEQRLAFYFDKHTEESISANLHLLPYVSGERLIKEFYKWYIEENPPTIIQRADDLQILKSIHQSLDGIGQILEAIGRESDISKLDTNTWLGLMFHRSELKQMKELQKVLTFSSAQLRLIREVIELHETHKALKRKIQDRELYDLLCYSSSKSIEIHLILATNHILRENMQRFLNILRHTKTSLTGNDLLQMGIKKSPLIGSILDSIRNARLNGSVTNKRQEIDFVKANYINN